MFSAVSANSGAASGDDFSARSKTVADDAAGLSLNRGDGGALAAWDSSGLTLALRLSRHRAEAVAEFRREIPPPAARLSLGPLALAVHPAKKQNSSPHTAAMYNRAVV